METGPVDQGECHVGFNPATWMMAYLDMDLCKVLVHKTLDTGYLLGPSISETPKHYIAIADVIHHEEGTSGMSYFRTGERVVIKAFTDAVAARKEAYLTACACSGLNESSRIVRLVDLLVDESFCYIIQEYIPGGDLLDRMLLAEAMPLPQSVVRSWFIDLLEALMCLHRRGIAHMDISPEVSP